MKYPILHAERDLTLHHGLKNLLSQSGEFEFAAHCSYMTSALLALDWYKPDILITGHHLEDEYNVVETFCEFRRTCFPGLKIIVLTDLKDMDPMINALIRGVDGYIRKDAPSEEIYKCIFDVFIGDSHIAISGQEKKSNKE